MWISTGKYAVMIDGAELWENVRVRAHSKECLVNFLGQHHCDLFGVDAKKGAKDLKYSVTLPRKELMTVLKLRIDQVERGDFLPQYDPFKGLNLDDPDIRAFLMDQ